MKREWVRCPVCGEPDMRSESDETGRVITCTNLACGTNGGSNFTAVFGGPSDLEEVAPELIAELRVLFDNYGPRGVVRVASRMQADLASHDPSTLNPNSPDFGYDPYRNIPTSKEQDGMAIQIGLYQAHALSVPTEDSPKFLATYTRLDGQGPGVLLDLVDSQDDVTLGRTYALVLLEERAETVRPTPQAPQPMAVPQQVPQQVPHAVPGAVPGMVPSMSVPTPTPSQVPFATPTPQYGAVPGMVPQIQQVPGLAAPYAIPAPQTAQTPYLVPGRVPGTVEYAVPVPQAVQAPYLVPGRIPEQVHTPSYAVPAPQMIQVPHLVPGRVPGTVEVQYAVPAPQMVQTPYLVPPRTDLTEQVQQQMMNEALAGMKAHADRMAAEYEANRPAEGGADGPDSPKDEKVKTGSNTDV